MNRIEIAAANLEIKLRDLSAEKVAILASKMSMELWEHASYHEKNTLAYARGVLTLSESMLVNEWLGGTVSTYNGQSLARKIALIQLFAEILLTEK